METSTSKPSVMEDTRRRHAVDAAVELAARGFGDLHPVERAKAWREVQAQAAEAATDQERENTENGVPD